MLPFDRRQVEYLGRDPRLTSIGIEDLSVHEQSTGSRQKEDVGSHVGIRARSTCTNSKSGDEHHFLETFELAHLRGSMNLA